MLMDMASEMLYPIGPIYLTTVLGASIAWVGIIEGIAEAIAGLSKGYFGALSDARGVRRPFVTIGYALSALSKPLPALFPSISATPKRSLLIFSTTLSLPQSPFRPDAPPTGSGGSRSSRSGYSCSPSSIRSLRLLHHRA